VPCRAREARPIGELEVTRERWAATPSYTQPAAAEPKR
jgi:hypothetical protein